jgi:hypothetical protein
MSTNSKSFNPGHPPKLFLIERRNKRFLNDRTRWTSHERRSASRLGITCVICLCITIVLVANHRDTLQLLSLGQKTAAVTVAKRLDSDTNSRYVSYEFQTGATSTLTKVEKRTPGGVFDSSVVGDLVPVLYERSNPNHCLVGYQIASADKDKSVLAGWLTLSMALLIFMFLAHYRNRLLRSSGIVLKGSLGRLRLLGGGAEDPDKVDVLYSFATRRGIRIEAHFKGSAWRSNFSDFSPSALEGNEPVVVAVLYLSDQKYAML